MSNSLTDQERRSGHSADPACGDPPRLGWAIRTDHEAKLHDRLSD